MPRRKLHERTGRLEVYYLLAGYAEALWRTGDTDRALTVLEDALAVVRRICNPGLIVDALGLRAAILKELPDSASRIAADVAESNEICARYGLVAWPGPVTFQSPG